MMDDFTIEKGLVDGQTIAEWTKNWWTWALQAPADHNPLIDNTGSFAGTDNFGPVFFIGGTFATGQNHGFAERTFDVPAGKPLLIPVLNQFDTLDPKSVENKVMSNFQKSVTGLFAEIDGIPVKNLQSDLVRTDFFSMGMTRPGSLIEQLGAPSGADLFPTKSSGYWLMVQGLEPGQHTLHFGGSLNTGFSTEVIDHITVV